MSENPNLLTTFPFSSLRSSRRNPQLTRPSRLAAGRRHLMRLCVRQRAARSSCVRAARAGPARAQRQRRLTCWRTGRSACSVCADRLEPGTASSWHVAAWSTGAAPPGRSGPAARPHARELLVPRCRCLMRPWPALAAPRMQAATLGHARWSCGTCLMRAWCAPPVGAPHGPSCRHRVRPRRARLRRGCSAAVHADDRWCARTP